MALPNARLARFLLAVIVVVVGVVMGRVIEAVAVAAVLLAISAYIQRMVAGPDEAQDGTAGDFGSGDR